MAGTLDGKVVLITGAGRGLGRVMTLGLLNAGAVVAAADIDAPALAETTSAAHDSDAGDRLLDIVADVTRDDIAPKIVRVTTERYRRPDILINNAGINMSLFRPPEIKDTSKSWEVEPKSSGGSWKSISLRRF